MLEFRKKDLKRVIKDILRQSVFKNLLIVYLVSQLGLLLVLPNLLARKLDGLDKFAVSVNVWNILSEIDLLEIQDARIKVLKGSSGYLFFGEDIKIPLPDSFKKILPLKLRDLEFFLVSGDDTECLQANSLFYLSKDGRFYLKNPDSTCQLFNLRVFSFFYDQTNLTLNEFIKILKINILLNLSLRNLKVVGLETAVFFGGALLGLVFFIFFTLMGLFTTVIVYPFNLINLKEPFGNIFTLANFVSLIIHIVGLSLLDFFNLALTFNRLFAMLLTSAGLTYYLISKVKT